MKPELAAINSALGACAALFRAQDADRDRQSQCAELDRDADAEHKKLDALADWVESTMGPMCGEGRPAAGAAAAAAAIRSCAHEAIKAQRQALAAQRSETAARLARGYDGRALRHALDLYFGHFELAGTRWSLRWERATDGKPPSASAIAAAPGSIEAEFSIAVPSGAPWWQPTRLSDLADPGATKISGVDGKPVSPSKLYLAGVTWHMGNGTLLVSKNKRKLATPMLVSFPDGAPTITAVDASGAPTGPAQTPDRATADYLEAVWTKLSSAAEDLIEARGSATSLKHDGAEVEELRSPAAMASAMLAAMGPGLRRIREEHAESSPGVLDALRKKFVDLPASYRAAIERAGLGDPNNPLAIDEEALTMPFAARNDDTEIDIDDSLFGTSTVDELVDNLTLEGTLPGHVPAISRDATAPL